jgi:hypothetical protein
VPRSFTQHEIVEIIANSKEEAMRLVQDDEEDFKLVEIIDGDVEVNFHDITEIKE